jgi:hypothetical protein
MRKLSKYLKGIWNWITLNGREREREKGTDIYWPSKWTMYFLCCYVVVTFDYCLGWIHNKPTIIVADGGSPGMGGKVRVQQHPAGGLGDHDVWAFRICLGTIPAPFCRILCDSCRIWPRWAKVIICLRPSSLTTTAQSPALQRRNAIIRKNSTPA